MLHSVDGGAFQVVEESLPEAGSRTAQTPLIVVVIFCQWLPQEQADNKLEQLDKDNQGETVEETEVSSCRKDSSRSQYIANMRICICKGVGTHGSPVFWC